MVAIFWRFQARCLWTISSMHCGRAQLLCSWSPTFISWETSTGPIFVNVDFLVSEATNSAESDASESVIWTRYLSLVNNFRGWCIMSIRVHSQQSWKDEGYCVDKHYLTIPTAFSLLREAEWRRRSHVEVCENTSSMQYSTIHRLYQCHLIPPVHMNSMVCRDALKPKELSSAKGIDSIFLTPSHIVSLELEPISLSDTLLRYYCQNKNEYRRFHWGRGCLQLTLGWYWLPQPLLVQL